MRITKSILFVLFLALAVATAQAESKQWLHLHAEDSHKNETVKINIPLTLVEAMLPLVEQKGVKDGKIRLNEKDINVRDLRKVWNQLREEGDMEYASIQNRDTSLRIFTKGEFFYVEPDADSRKQVEMKIPLAVVDAMLSGKEDELNLMAAVRALQRSGVRDIITVKSEDSTLRVWVDESNRAK
ncbi:MAG TPA: hypothetical protein VJ521_07210 [Acidobacteriota bacterium]|nr:hypothetical protein [Acidobacteriota bacterium]